MVLAVQFPNDLSSRDGAGLSIHEGVAGEASVSDHFQRLDSVVDEVIRQHPVDRQRIYLAGISLGASRCWQYAWRHPDRFAAILAMATGPLSDRAVEDLRRLSTWAFQSIADGPAQLQRMAQSMCRIAEPRGELATIDCEQSHTRLLDIGAEGLPRLGMVT